MLEGEAAAGTAYAVPAAAGLEPGTTYYWYVTPRDREGRWAYAPVEGIFAVAAHAVGSDSLDTGTEALPQAAAAPRRAAPAQAGSADSPSDPPIDPPRHDPRRRPRAGGL